MPLQYGLPPRWCLQSQRFEMSINRFFKRVTDRSKDRIANQIFPVRCWRTIRQLKHAAKKRCPARYQLAYMTRYNHATNAHRNRCLVSKAGRSLWSHINSATHRDRRLNGDRDCLQWCFTEIRRQLFHNRIVVRGRLQPSGLDQIHTGFRLIQKNRYRQKIRILLDTIF